MEQNARIYEDLDRILVTKEEIAEKVKELGRRITEDYAGKEPVMVCILKGAVIFFSDLIREIDLPLTADFMAISSYGSATKTSGVVRVLKDLDKDIVGKDVIIVEDIIDTGTTMYNFLPQLKEKGVKSVEIATLLMKPGKLKVPLDIKYCAMEIPNEFIVGYGLDYDDIGRNYKSIYVVKEN